MDDNDDDGENRDGDENWYQQRTQQFCANAAFSLYGIPKNHVALPLTHCTRGHYIDSFFTYGGADTLLEAVGKSPAVYYDDDYQGTSNSECHVLSGGNNYNNYDNNRDLGSGDNNNYDPTYGTSSTMGCSANGKFAVATFQGQTCDGNYLWKLSTMLGNTIAKYCT